MMWILIAILMFSTNTGYLKALTLTNSTTSEITNLSLMVSLAMSLNYLMMTQSTSKSDEKMKWIIMMVGIMVLVSFSTDSSMMYLILMEATVVPLSYTILNSSKQKDKMTSLKFMVLMNTLGSVPFMVYLYWSSEMMEYPSETFLMSSTTGIIMMFSLFIIKTPMFMTHIWLTKVHVSASGNCSMMLASIMIKMGTVGMLKFYKKFGKEKFFYLILSLSLTSSLYLSLTMYRYFDTKTLIAMSSVLHMALVFPMLMVKTDISMVSSVMMMTAHGVISYYLFYLVTMKYEMSQNRSYIMMKSTESKNKNMAVAMIVFMFLNLGLPPFMNFMSETCFIGMMKAMNSQIMIILMMSVLLMSVMFTMQMNSSETYGKIMKMSKKMEHLSFGIKSLFFFKWSFAIIFCF